MKSELRDTHFTDYNLVYQLVGVISIFRREIYGHIQNIFTLNSIKLSMSESDKIVK